MCLRQCNGTNQITIGFSRFQVANMPGVAISLIVFLLCTPLLFIYGICVCICLYKCVYINITEQFVSIRAINMSWKYFTRVCVYNYENPVAFGALGQCLFITNGSMWQYSHS